MIECILSFYNIHFDSLVLIRQLPGRIENEPGAITQEREIDLFYRIGRLMVVGVGTVEVEDNRNVVLGKVIVIGAIVEPVRVVGGIVRIIQVELGIAGSWRLR